MKRLLTFLLLVILVSVVADQAMAQCAMCTATAETTRDAGSSAADGLNKGVMYLFFTPYLVIGTIAYFWFRARRKADNK